MKKTLLPLTMLAVAAGMALAQCPDGGPCRGGPCQMAQGTMMEKREVRMQGGPGMGMRGQWWKDPEMVKQLALTDKQLSDIEDMTTRHRKEMIKQDADLKIMRMDMRKLIEDNAADADIRAQSKKVSQLKQKMHDAMLEHMLDLRRVLTTEQQQKLKELKKTMGRGRMMMDMDRNEGMDKD